MEQRPETEEPASQERSERGQTPTPAPLPPRVDPERPRPAWGPPCREGEHGQTGAAVGWGWDARAVLQSLGQVSGSGVSLEADVWVSRPETTDRVVARLKGLGDWKKSCLACLNPSGPFHIPGFRWTGIIRKPHTIAYKSSRKGSFISHFQGNVRAAFGDRQRFLEFLRARVFLFLCLFCGAGDRT